MKLNLNSQEVLALHNLLHARYGADADEDKERSGDVYLRQVYNRLRACIVSALASKATDPFEAWSQREQAKIDDLKQQNDELKEVVTDLASSAPVILTIDPSDDDFAEPYPRRTGNPSGKRRGGKR
jgi:hypothetical protein